jgi:hypothetical protein
MTEATSLANNLEPRICRSVATGMPSERTRHLAFVAITASLFAVAAALTLVWCAPGSAMVGIAMPGGSTMSMPWTRMPGQT